MALEHIVNHIVQALDRLPQQYRGKERFAALLSALVNQVQEIEDALWQLFGERSLATSEGVQLDGIGEIVGLDRLPNMIDDDYRTALEIQIIQNMNEATPEEIIAAVLVFTGAATINYNELYPAAVSIFTPIVMTEDEVTAIRAKIKRLLGAGISLSDFGHSDEDNPFIFDGGNGFGDTANPTSGGKLADLY